MKIRTDFVTNSSSSNFVVEVEVEFKDSSRYVFETKPTDEGTNSNFNCTADDIVKASSVDELCRLLQKSMSGTGKTKIKDFVSDIQENAADINDVSSVTLRRIWISWGESSGCTVANDKELMSLSQNVVSAKGVEQDGACRKLEEYLDSAEVRVVGGWQDEWPTRFCQNQAVPKYSWRYLGISLKDLAKKIVSAKISNDDMAVETVKVNMGSREITESAEFIIDSNEKAIGRKPAKRSNAFLREVIEKACPEGYELKSDISAAEIVPDYSGACDPIDYVIFKAENTKAAVSVKTAENGRSKTFRAIALFCEKAGIPYVLLDEKKDNTESRIINKITEALYADVFKKYVVEASEEGFIKRDAAQSGTGISIKVKFADNRSYEYKCFESVKPGNIVYVGGAKSGCPGMVIAVTGDNPPIGLVPVTAVLKPAGE